MHLYRSHGSQKFTKGVIEIPENPFFTDRSSGGKSNVALLTKSPPPSPFQTATQTLSVSVRAWDNIMCDIWSTYPRLKRSTAGVLEVLMQACSRRIFQNLSTHHVKALSVSLKLSSFQVRSIAALPTRRKMEELKISDMKVVPCVDSRFIQPARVVFKQVSVTHWTWSYQSLTGVDQGFGCLDRWMGVSQTVYTPDARSPDWKYKSFCINTLYQLLVIRLMWPGLSVTGTKVAVI